MTEIEKGLNLHLNYNITKVSPKEEMFARRVRKSIEQDKDGTQKTDPSSKEHDLFNNFTSDDDFVVKNYRKRTRQKTRNRIRQKITPTLSDLSKLYDKNNGGTMGPRQIRNRNRKQKPKYRKLKGRTDPVNHQCPDSGDHKNTPPPSPQYSIDSKCGCCREKLPTPPESSQRPKRLNKAEIDAIQKQIDDLIARGCKVFQFQGSIVYSCENK